MEAYHTITIESDDEGGCTVTHETNDNEDRGYPNEFARWTERDKDFRKALKRAGKEPHRNQRRPGPRVLRRNRSYLIDL